MGESVKNKVAIVTGGGGGIGRAICYLLAKEGAKVVVNDVGSAVDGSGTSNKVADSVVTEITKSGGTAIANYDSVTTMEGGENIVKAALNNYGQLDIVVTPHGILRDRMLFNMTEQEWDSVIETHLKGTFTVCKHASILFRQQKSGRIITFSSTSGLVGNPGQANYGAAKSGIAGFTKVVARDLGRYGVTVNCIAPLANTRMTMSIPESAQRLSKESGITRGADESGLEQAEDIAPMVVYLASDYASNVNGQIFLVHGGTISLMSQPRPIRTIYSHQQQWNLDELSTMALKYLVKDLPNPAPHHNSRV